MKMSKSDHAKLFSLLKEWENLMNELSRCPAYQEHMVIEELARVNRERAELRAKIERENEARGS